MPISAAAMRRKLYGPLLSKLRALMIARMAKPEEVIVVEDENGNIVRETMKDTDVLARYKTMHETLVYLSHLDHEDTERQMLENLRLQVGWWRGWGGMGVYFCHTGWLTSADGLQDVGFCATPLRATPATVHHALPHP